MNHRMLNCPSVAAVMLMILAAPRYVDAQQASVQEVLRISRQASELAAVGRYLEAIPLAQRALEIQEETPGPDLSDTAILLNNLAQLYVANDEYTKAEPLLLRALAIREKVLGPDHPNTAGSLNNLARLYTATGAYTKAEPLHQRALAILEKVLGPDHPGIANLLHNLARLYAANRAYTKAEPLYQRALTIREKALRPDDPQTAALLSNLARLHADTGAYTKAEPLHQRALAIYEKAFGPDHPETAASLNNLARIYDDTGAYTRAEPLYQRALAIYEKEFGPDHPQNTDVLNNLATLHVASGALMQAAPLYERAQAIDERNATRLLLAGSESHKQQYLRQMVGTVSGHVSLSMSYPSARHTALGLTSVLRYKGRVLDAMSDGIAQLRRNPAPQDRVLLDKLSDVARELSVLIFRSLAEPGARERFDSLAQQQASLQAELASRSAASAGTLAPVTLDGVRHRLPADAALIEWVRYWPFDPKAKRPIQLPTPRYAAYVLGRTGDPVAIDVGEAKPIEELIVSFRSALTNPITDSRGAKRTGSDAVNVSELAAALSEKLFKPLVAHLARRERLLISPDGALSLFPFAALLDEHGQYLAQKFEISYLTSGRDLLRIADTPARSGPVVLANPTFGSAGFDATTTHVARSTDLDRSGLVFDPLPGTAAEAKTLQSLLELDAQYVLTGDRATEAQLRALHGPRILHLATHGFFLKDENANPSLDPFLGFGSSGPALPADESLLLRSGLALAGANQRRSGAADDGILTAAEVAQLDLLGTQLVVLSGCETALGPIDVLEGVYGLRRALVLAGAQSQLVSLWKVDDAATSELITDYYQRLLRGEGRAAALRNAQSAMLARPSHQHPYYWAAFIPIGNWMPLR